MKRSKITYFASIIVLYVLFISKCLAIELPDIEMDNINLNTWVTGYAPMPTGRNALASARYKDKIYCIGGWNGSRQDKVEVYDITNDSWSEVTPMPTKRSNLIAQQYNGKIYCIGGWNGQYYNMVEVYDIETDTWETKTPMPTPRRSMASAIKDGKIYIAGGINANGYVDILEVYDINTDTWKTLANMPTAREGLTAECYKDKVYFVGGKNANYLDVLEVYDISKNKWEVLKPMSIARGYLSSEIYAGNVYVLGGRNTTTFMDKVEIYDIENDVWIDGTNIPTERDALVSEIYRGKIYAIGGNNGGYRKEVEAYYIYEPPEDRAYSAIKKAQKTQLIEDIENARNLTNELDESQVKEIFQELITDISLNMGIVPQSITSNLDLYIKSENILSLSLDTNQITFEDFSGVEDIEKINAVNIVINSSLPYQLNAYLPTEIQNSDKSNVMDKSILNIKENSESNYQVFPNTTDKIILKDNCSAGNDLVHGVDIKLSGGISHEKDVYKTTIKFEAEQK